MTASAALAMAALDSLADAVAVVDADARIIFTNEAWRRLDSLAGPDAPGSGAIAENYIENWERHSDHLAETAGIVEGIRKALGGGRSHIQTEYRLATPYGPRQVVVGITSFESGEGRTIISRHDVTEQRRSETQAHTLLAIDDMIGSNNDTGEVVTATLAEIRIALDADLVAVFLWEDDTRVYRAAGIAGADPVQEKLIRESSFGRGQPFDHFVEKNQLLVIHDPAEQGWIPREVSEGLGLEQIIVAGIGTDRRHLGSLIAAQRHVGPPFDNGQIELCGAVARRLGPAIENIRLIEELGTASRLKSEFVATMSHELRTPLHVVLGYSGLLLDDAFGELTAEQRDGLERIERNGSTLLELINETLSLSRLDAGEVPVEIERVNLGELFERVAAEGGVPVDTHGVDYQTAIADDLPLVESDQGKLEVIVRNLLSNAFKFTTQGHVILRARATDDGVEFTITDTGEGIEPDVQQFVFEPFRQGADPLTRRVGGAGLGLHLVRRYTELLGGNVSLESELSEGSTFKVSLPLRAPASLRNSKSAE